MPPPPARVYSFSKKALEICCISIYIYIDIYRERERERDRERQRQRQRQRQREREELLRVKPCFHLKPTTNM